MEFREDVWRRKNLTTRNWEEIKNMKNEDVTTSATRFGRIKRRSWKRMSKDGIPLEKSAGFAEIGPNPVFLGCGPPVAQTGGSSIFPRCRMDIRASRLKGGK